MLGFLYSCFHFSFFLFSLCINASAPLYTSNFPLIICYPFPSAGLFVFCFFFSVHGLIKLTVLYRESVFHLIHIWCFLHLTFGLLLFVCMMTHSTRLSLTVLFRGSQTRHSDLLCPYWRADHAESFLTNNAWVSSWQKLLGVCLEESPWSMCAFWRARVPNHLHRYRLAGTQNLTVRVTYPVVCSSLLQLFEWQSNT